MDASNLIAVFALVVSLLSAWISYRAYRYTVHMREEELRLTFSREKSEFLVRTDKARKTFDRLEQRLKALLGAIDRASDNARTVLADEADKIRSDLKYLEGCQRQAWSLWDETYEMSQSSLAHHKPRFLGLIEDDEHFASESHLRCDQTEEAIAKAGTKLTMFFV